MSTTNASATTSAAETEARAMIASAAWASGHFGLAAHVPELVRAGASAGAIVEAVWTEMSGMLSAKAGLTRIGRGSDIEA